MEMINEDWGDLLETPDFEIKLPKFQMEKINKPVENTLRLKKIRSIHNLEESINFPKLRAAPT